MDASESIFFLYFRLIDKTFWLGLHGILVHPALQMIVFVENQIANGLSWTREEQMIDQESGYEVLYTMEVLING